MTSKQVTPGQSDPRTRPDCPSHSEARHWTGVRRKRKMAQEPASWPVFLRLEGCQERVERSGAEAVLSKGAFSFLQPSCPRFTVCSRGGWTGGWAAPVQSHERADWGNCRGRLPPRAGGRGSKGWVAAPRTTWLPVTPWGGGRAASPLPPGWPAF